MRARHPHPRHPHHLACKITHTSATPAQRDVRKDARVAREVVLGLARLDGSVCKIEGAQRRCLEVRQRVEPAPLQQVVRELELCACCRSEQWRGNCECVPGGARTPNSVSVLFSDATKSTSRHHGERPIASVRGGARAGQAAGRRAVGHPGERMHTAHACTRTERCTAAEMD